MFFPNSRSRFKSKPPRIFVYCLEFVCLVVLLTLLIAQLRAVELPNETKNVPRQQKAQPEVFINQFENNPTSSIDRDDRANAYDDGATPPVMRHPADVEVKKVPIESPTQDTANKQAEFIAPQKIDNTSYPSIVLDGGDDLFVSPATAQTVQSVSHADSESSTTNGNHFGINPDVQRQRPAPLPSLAEMTAAGTAAGMLIQDLMAQANMIYDKSALDNNSNEIMDPEKEQNSSAGLFSGDAELSAQMQQMATNDQQQGPLIQDQRGLDQGDDDEDSNQQSAMLSRAEAIHRLNPIQTAPESNEAQEPASEDASPDSIESLMGADGADLNANDGGQDQSELEEQPQQLADSNLVNSNEAYAGQLAVQSQYAGVPASNYNDYDEDSDESDSPRAIDAQSSQLRAKHYEGSLPVLMSTRYSQPSEEFASSRRFGSELEHNLVAPMRESLVDLNTAAGHYHGKKKKIKKVKKKIVIKKKKKKKKKKKMYKKVKIVKIKKEEKKYPKKKHHHHAHHHDHGKYYMYAKVPKKKAWEFGFKKGNKKHWIERHEKGYKNKFKTKVKWYDKKSKGKGVHIWDYNHHDKKKKKHH